MTPETFRAFRALSARLGADPLQIQGPGGNTSIKDGDTLWIKASGTNLSDAMAEGIFVAVDLPSARAEAHGDAGDGSCRGALRDPDGALRPSIETTFHAAIDWPVVVHTHSVAALTHAIAPKGRKVAMAALADLDAVAIPYAKPGLPLTSEITAAASGRTRIFLLENHGLICAAATVEEVGALIAEVERRLVLKPRSIPQVENAQAPEGWRWSNGTGWIAQNPRACKIAQTGPYWPDQVVFLGPTLTETEDAPVRLVPGQGILIRDDATGPQNALLTCLSDVLARLPDEWTPQPLTADAVAELLDWDAEKYRQALAARQ